MTHCQILHVTVYLISAQGIKKLSPSQATRLIFLSYHIPILYACIFNSFFFFSCQYPFIFNLKTNENSLHATNYETSVLFLGLTVIENTEEKNIHRLLFFSEFALVIVGHFLPLLSESAQTIEFS